MTKYEYFINHLEITKKNNKFKVMVKVYLNKGHVFFEIDADLKSELLNKILCKSYMQNWIKEKILEFNLVEIKKGDVCNE